MSQKEAPRIGLLKPVVARRMTGHGGASSPGLRPRAPRDCSTAAGAAARSAACPRDCGSGWRRRWRRRTGTSMTAMPRRSCRRSKDWRSAAPPSAGCAGPCRGPPSTAAGPGSIALGASPAPAWARWSSSTPAPSPGSRTAARPCACTAPSTTPRHHAHPARPPDPRPARRHHRARHPHPVRPAVGLLRRPPQRLSPQRPSLGARGTVARGPGPDPLRAHVAGARHRLHPRRLSPQAKGRIERLWQTLQGRLVTALRPRGIATPETAHASLPAFLVRKGIRIERRAGAQQRSAAEVHRSTGG